MISVGYAEILQRLIILYDTPVPVERSIKFVHQDCLLQWLSYSDARGLALGSFYFSTFFLEFYCVCDELLCYLNVQNFLRSSSLCDFFTSVLPLVFNIVCDN